MTTTVERPKCPWCAHWDCRECGHRHPNQPLRDIERGMRRCARCRGGNGAVIAVYHRPGPMADSHAELARKAAEAVSDGTMRCPVPHPEGADAPCTKRIPKGWTADEGHPGGHWWMARETADALERGDHYDAHAAMAGEPFSFHREQDCPGFPECNDWRAKPRTSTPDSGSSVRSADVETKPCPECGGVCRRRPGGWSCIHEAGCGSEWKRDGW